MYFVLHTLQGWEITNSLNSFLNNFHINNTIATKFWKIIWAFIVNVFTQNELCRLEIRLGIAFFIDLRRRA